MISRFEVDAIDPSEKIFGSFNVGVFGDFRIFGSLQARSKKQELSAGNGLGCPGCGRVRLSDVVNPLGLVTGARRRSDDFSMLSSWLPRSVGRPGRCGLDLLR